ncbi:YobA family protein [Thalassobacillus hwangdonensis]|uniref:YobA family protein n=1 Tax=Thalassobacillus hwangdonensis TaxID=546108 RepID=A0ABW3L2W4_9BACI
MKFLCTLAVCVILFLPACSQDEDEFTGPPTIEGYILQVNETELLVVNGITKDQAVASTWEDLAKSSSINNAIIFHRKSWWDDYSDWEVGEKVKVWGDGGMNDSFPGQVKLGKIEITE